MNYFAFSALVNLAASSILFIIMVSKTNRSRYDTWFAGFCFSTAVWSTGYFFWQIATTPEAALFWTRFLMAGAIIVGLTYLQFVLSFLEVSAFHKTLSKFANIIFGIFFLMNFGSGIVSKVEPRFWFNFWPVPGNIFHLYLIVWGLSVFYSTYLLYKSYIVSQGLLRRQISLLFFGMAIAFVAGSTNYFLWYNIPIPPVANILVTVYPLLVFYAIAKYGFFNTKIITAEIFALTLIGTSIWTFFIRKTSSPAITASLIFLIVSAGILLIRSVMNEAMQREQLEALTRQLADANEKLKSLDRARAEFITIASHQLRTPPATIKWYLSSVLDGDYGTLKPEQKEILEKTNRTNNSLISLVDDMLNVSRIERGKMEFLFEQVSMLDLANITFEQLEPIAKDKKLKLTFKSSPKTKFPKLMADKEKIRQVMNNLIDNALKYTKQGSVDVALTAVGDEIKFSVTDSGKGILPEEQTSIFEKYTRGKESVKQSAGLGLGLYVAKIIVAQHKGKIWAESPGTGKGSSFIFTLPIKNDLKETTLVDLAKNQG